MQLLADRGMQLNQGLFQQNARCGYVLQPECLRNQGYDPYNKKTLPVSVEPLTISITVGLLATAFSNNLVRLSKVTRRSL